MRILTLILLVFLASSCATHKLNKKIDAGLQESLKASPFDSADDMFVEIEKRFKERRYYLRSFRKVLKSNYNDTILLTEIYFKDCDRCPYKIVKAFSTDSTIWLPIWSDLSMKKWGWFEYEPVYLHQYDYSNVLKAANVLRDSINKGSEWNSNPKTYAADDCTYGSHSFITVFYPSGKMEYLYIKCWDLRRKE